MRYISLVLLIASTLHALAPAETNPPTLDSKIKVLIVTGGHGFQRKEFFALFDANKDIAWQEAVYNGKTLNATTLLAGQDWRQYDVFVFYDMQRNSPEKTRQGIAALGEAGKGIVMLHHTLAAQQDWPEYKRIVGGKYYTKKTVEHGKTYGPSTYKHDVDINIGICDPKHPITYGLKPFSIRDETYNGYDVLPGVTPLLTTDHPTSVKNVGWTHTYKKSRVVYLQQGHDAHAYKNPVFRTLIGRSIRYVAGRPATDQLPWQPVFNGKNLDNWKAVGGASWQVKDGILTGEQGDNFAAGDLYTKDTFDDFEVTATFRVRWPANSGLWFRYQNHGKAYQADILEFKNPVCWTGTLYCGGYAKLFLSMNKDPSLLKKDGWNTFVIRAAHTHLVVFLNGHKVGDVINDASPSGQFGIQVHQGAQFGPMRIEFKTLKVRKI